MLVLACTLQVGHVVLFDFPRDGIEFVRRVGRVRSTCLAFCALRSGRVSQGFTLCSS